MKLYKIKHKELVEIFRRWSADVIANPDEYKKEDATPEDAERSARVFVEWLKKVQK